MSTALLLTLLTASDGAIAVLPLQAKRVEADIAAILDDVLTTDLTTHHGRQVISSSDIEAMLNVEQQRDAMGCDDVACAAEIGGALGARYLVTGSVSRLGETLIVQLSLIDSAAVAVEARAKSSVPYQERYFESAVRDAIAQLLGAEPTDATLRPGSKIIFNTAEEELEFAASVITVTGQQLGCGEGIRRDSGCTVGAVPTGDARVVVSAANHNPATETTLIENENATMVYRVDSKPSGWSWLCYMGGGAMVFTGGASLGLSQLAEETEGILTGIGITYLAVGTGLLTLGYFLDRDVTLERVDLSAEPSLTVMPTVHPGGAGLGAFYRW